MKKTLIELAALAAVGTASAPSTVTLSGPGSCVLILGYVLGCASYADQNIKFPSGPWANPVRALGSLPGGPGDRSWLPVRARGVPPGGPGSFIRFPGPPDDSNSRPGPGRYLSAP